MARKVFICVNIKIEDGVWHGPLLYEILYLRTYLTNWVTNIISISIYEFHLIFSSFCKVHKSISHSAIVIKMFTNSAFQICHIKSNCQNRSLAFQSPNRVNTFLRSPIPNIKSLKLSADFLPNTSVNMWGIVRKLREHEAENLWNRSTIKFYKN